MWSQAALRKILIKEQVAKCTFEGYNTDKAAQYALLFQTSNVKLQKKILTEDGSLEDTIKLEMAYEQTEAKSDQLKGGKGKGGKDSLCAKREGKGEEL